MTVGTMLAARLHGPGQLTVAPEPVPEPGPDEALVRVTAVGICGSDLHWYAEGGIGDARLSRPLVIGHEAAGVIETGPGRGRRVAIDPAVPCRECETCRAGQPNLCPAVRFLGHGETDGALRQLLAWPRRLLQPLPDGMTDAEGAMLEPLGVAVHAHDLSHQRLGAAVGVIGCGPIGLCLVQLARAAGAGRVLAADPLAHRAEAAARLGAEAVTAGDPADLHGDPAALHGDPAALHGDPADLHGDPAALHGDPAAWHGWPAADGRGAGLDVVFETAGTDAAVQAAIDAAAPGARVVLVGIPDRDSTTFTASAARRKGLTLVLVRRMKEVYPRAMALVRSGAVDVAGLVSDRFPIAEADRAFRTAHARAGLKVLIGPND